jgi:hypothetical protein
MILDACFVVETSGQINKPTTGVNESSGERQSALLVWQKMISPDEVFYISSNQDALIFNLNSPPAWLS